MKKHKILKNILLIFLIFSMLITSSGCNNTPEITDTEIIENDTETEPHIPREIKYDKVKDYQIIKTEKGYRLVFDDKSRYSGVGAAYAGFVINSINELSERLLAGELTYKEKVSIYDNFRRDDLGFMILNPYVSYKFSHPASINIFEKCFYHGVTFPVIMYFGEDFTPSYLFIEICDYYYSELAYSDEHDIHRLKEKKQNIEYEQELSNGKTLTCYNKETIESSSEGYGEQYILSDGVKTFLVEKKYSYESDNNTLSYIDVIGFIDECFIHIDFSFYADVYDYEYSDEVLTDEFLFGFDVETIERT